MEVNGQLRAQAALPPGKEPLSGRGGEEKEIPSFCFYCQLSVFSQNFICQLFFPPSTSSEGKAAGT